MKIKVCVANFGSYQLGYMNKVVEEFKNFKEHSVGVLVHTNVAVEHKHVLFPDSIGSAITFAHRQEMVNSVEDYDLFIYVENDMLITEDNVNAFLEHTKTLKDGEVSGFIRYEKSPDGRMVLVDPNPFWKPLFRAIRATTFQLHNVHQGSWILTQKDLKKAISTGGFLVSHHFNGPYGSREQGASDPYTQCGLTKVFPMNYDLCKRLLIHHLPNKYITDSHWQTYGVELNELFFLIDKEPIRTLTPV